MIIFYSKKIEVTVNKLTWTYNSHCQCHITYVRHISNKFILLKIYFNIIIAINLQFIKIKNCFIFHKFSL